jgi:uncharacterized cupin superfamily protein
VSFSDIPRVIHAAALPDTELPESPLDPVKVVSGEPVVRLAEIHDADDLGIGIWQHGVGVSTDVEVDEVFVVLSGRATIEVDGGPTLEVGPGDVGHYPAGTRTTWTVHETLRKVYVVRP